MVLPVNEGALLFSISTPFEVTVEKAGVDGADISASLNWMTSISSSLERLNASIREHLSTASLRLRARMRSEITGRSQDNCCCALSSRPVKIFSDAGGREEPATSGSVFSRSFISFDEMLCCKESSCWAKISICCCPVGLDGQLISKIAST